MDSDVDEDSLASVEEQRLTSSEAVEQENTDPTFEELLFNFINNQVIPNFTETSSCLATPLKRVRRSRANSVNSDCYYPEKSIIDDTKAVESVSDSEKSSSTNEQTFLNTAASSWPSSAEKGNSPYLIAKTKSRSY